MNEHQKQIEAFDNDVGRLIDRYRSEFDLTYADVIGVLHKKAHSLCEEAAQQLEDE